MFESHADINLAAEALREAQSSGVPCPPIRDAFEADDLKSAYVIQDTNVQASVSAGRRIVGRKIGLTSPAVQAQLGVDQPDYGTLFADMCFASGAEINTGPLISPRCEAEVALVLSRDLDQDSHNILDMLASTAFALPALEIVDSRIANWDIRITDTIADNGSSALFVLGSQPVALSQFDIGVVPMQLTKNGEMVSEGSGEQCLGNPLQAAIWLADTLAAMKIPLKAGEVILTGALGPMVSIEAGDSFSASLGKLGNVAVQFAPSV